MKRLAFLLIAFAIVCLLASAASAASLGRELVDLESHIKWSAVDGLLLEFESNVRWRAVDEAWKARRDSWVSELKGE